MATKPPTDQPLIRGFEHSVSLPIFEGPLDLLLFLIRKTEIDIYDIPIERITQQYLEILRNMEHQRLEVAGEFFVMAASLMQIKSRMLLPKDEQLPGIGEDEEEETDPRWELVQQLIEYKKFKEAAGSISELMAEAQNILFREYFIKSEDKPERPLHPSDPVAVWNVFNQVLRRLSEKIVIGQIHDEVITIAERMEDIIVELKTRSTFRFSELIDGPVSIHFVVSTFLALLELTRLRKIRIEQDDFFTDILCTAHEE
jgi:segregation and condensation protein A